MKKELSSKNESLIYNKQCSILNMTAIPYLGIYSQNYTFMHPNFVLHKPDIKDSVQFFPEKMRAAINELQTTIDMQNVDYFVSHIDGTYLYEKYIKSHSDQLLRINLVLHPYIFQDLTNLTKDHKINIMPTLYRSDKDDPIYNSSGDVIDTIIIMLYYLPILGNDNN